MGDVYELKMQRLGLALEEMGGLEEKADGPPGKGGKKKPMPPWLNKPADDDDDESDDTDDSDDSSDDDDEDDDEDEKPPSKKPAKGKLPPQFQKGTKAARPGTGFMPKQPERGGNGRKPAVRASANRTGAEVQPIAWAGPADGGKRKKRSGMGSKAAPKGAARITTWGPVNQHVDVRRGRGDGAMDQGPSDPRLRRASREQDTDSFRPRRGPAGGNGVTRAVAGNEIQQNTPGRLKKRPARRDGWSPSADVGEGHTGGRSGSAIVSNPPQNVRKDLWSYSADEVENALLVATKALQGLRRDLDDADFR